MVYHRVPHRSGTCDLPRIPPTSANLLSSAKTYHSRLGRAAASPSTKSKDTAPAGRAGLTWTSIMGREAACTGDISFAPERHGLEMPPGNRRKYRLTRAARVVGGVLVRLHLQTSRLRGSRGFSKR
jgi:hypothetical protein